MARLCGKRKSASYANLQLSPSFTGLKKVKRKGAKAQRKAQDGCPPLSNGGQQHGSFALLTCQSLAKNSLFFIKTYPQSL